MASSVEPEDRDQILAMFQEITGNDNFDECRHLLESVDWNLDTAVNLSFATNDIPIAEANPPPANPLPAISTPPTLKPPHANTVDIDDDDIIDVTEENPWRELKASGSSDGTTRLKLIGPAGRGSTYTPSASSTWGDLRNFARREFNLAAEEGMVMSGVDGSCTALDTQPLSAYSFKNNEQLYIHTGPSSGKSGSSDRFRLNVTNVESGHVKDIFMNPTDTVRQVKQTAESIFNIPPRHQVWTGWPPAALDEFKLSDCHLDIPIHKLTLENMKLDTCPYKEGASSSANGIADVDVSSDEEIMDQSSDLFAGEASASLKNELPLIPEDVYSPAEGVDNFCRVFESRYGQIRPPFVVGSLDSAVAEAFSLAAGDKRPLAIYLHHDASITSNIFCTQVLGSDQVCQLLSANFVAWPWDVTSLQNKQKLLQWAELVFGKPVVESISSLSNERYPVLLIIGKQRSQYELMAMIHGGATPTEVMMQLMSVMDEWSKIVNAERSEEVERMQREQFRIEQEEAFNQAVEADFVKEQERMQEEEKIKKLEAEKEAQEIEDQKGMEHLARLVPPEPQEQTEETIATLRLRLPNGEFIQRRFLARSQLRDLLNFAASKGFSNDKYKLLTSYPKRDISTCSPIETLESLKLCPREQITVEER